MQKQASFFLNYSKKLCIISLEHRLYLQVACIPESKVYYSLYYIFNTETFFYASLLKPFIIHYSLICFYIISLLFFFFLAIFFFCYSCNGLIAYEDYYPYTSNFVAKEKFAKFETISNRLTIESCVSSGFPFETKLKFSVHS